MGPNRTISGLSVRKKLILQVLPDWAEVSRLVGTVTRALHVFLSTGQSSKAVKLPAGNPAFDDDVCVTVTVFDLYGDSTVVPAGCVKVSIRTYCCAKCCLMVTVSADCCAKVSLMIILKRG